VSARLRWGSGAALLAQTLLIACILSALEFLIFEPVARRTAIVEWVLSKPAFFSMSPFLSQLVSFCAVSTAFLVLCCAVFLLLSSFARTPPMTALPALANLLTVFTLIAIRAYKYPSEASRIGIFAAICLFLAYLYLLVNRLRTSREQFDNSSGFLPSVLLEIAIVSLMLSSAFLAPDFYSMYKRSSSARQFEGPVSPNVILIIMDTVRADHISCCGYEKSTTPHIDAIARDSAVFLNAYSAAPWTVPSHASIFTGLYPSQHHTDSGNVILGERLVTLAESLRASGYRTVGFTENPFLARAHGFSQGFDEYHELWKRSLFIRVAARLANGTFGYHETREYTTRTFGLLQRWLVDHSRSGKPFFVFVNLMAAHLPSYPRDGIPNVTPEDLARIEPVNLVPERFYLEKYRLSPHELDVMLELYDAEIRYLDAQIGAFLSFLDAERTLENSIIIITSDHGENFGDYTLIEHQYCLYDTLIKVPLIVRFPKKLSPGLVQERVSTVRLFSSIRELLELPPELLPGQAVGSLFSDSCNATPIIAEHANNVDMLRGLLASEEPDFDYSRFDANWRCILDGDLKFIWSSNGKHELYDLSRDPRELHNLAVEEPETTRRLGRRLDEWLAGLGPVAPTTERSIVDHATHDELRALGYVQ